MASTAQPQDWPELERAEIDGVPVVWVAGPPPLRAGLMFRVGRIDESLPVAGVSHLVEHLALSALGSPRYPFNGMVEDQRTSFVVAGSGDEVSDFMASVCDSLAALPLERTPVERNVLLTEAASKSPNLVTGLLAFRYGPNGLGLLGYDELGLRWLTADRANSWNEMYFNRDNAAVWLTGPPPPGLTLNLRSGERAPAPATQPVRQPLPSYVRQFSKVLGLSTLLPRGAGSLTLMRIADRRMRDRLRTAEGLIYSVSGSYLWVDENTAHVTLATDLLAENAGRVLDGILGVLDELARDGAKADELADDVGSFRRAQEDPQSMMGWLPSAAANEIADSAWVSPSSVLADMEALTPEAISGLATTALAEALFLLPNGTPVADDRFQAFVAWSSDRVKGRVHARQGEGGKPASSERLIVGPEGITLDRTAIGEGQLVTVRFDRCAAALSWDDGTRVLHGYDGFRLEVRPPLWVQADAIVAAIDAAVPAERVVPMGAVAPAGPAAAPPPGAKVQPKSQFELRLRSVPLVFLIIGFLAGSASLARGTTHSTLDPLTGMSVSTTTGSNPLLAFVVLIGAVVCFLLWLRVNRGKR